MIFGWILKLNQMLLLINLVKMMFMQKWEMVLIRNWVHGKILNVEPTEDVNSKEVKIIMI